MTFAFFASCASLATVVALAWNPRELEDRNQSCGSSLLNVDDRIQKALHIATELLGIFRHLQFDPRHSLWIRAEIEGVTKWLIFLIGEAEQIGTGVSQQQPKVLKLATRVVCENCRTNSRNELGVDRREVLRSLPTWEKQVGSLLARTKRIGSEVFEQSCASSTLSPFPDCLTKLVQVLTRLEQDLDSMRGGTETKIESEYDADQCAECGGAIDPPPEAAL